MSVAAERDDNLYTEQFTAFIRNSAFPCVGAKSALARHQLSIIVAQDINIDGADPTIYTALIEFVASYTEDPRLFQSFAVIFSDGPVTSESGFEAALWRRLQSLEQRDAWRGHVYDPRVSPNPENPHFALSFGGEAFFVVGLHPRASRTARRFHRPTLVFNLHDQFERLRDEGRYEPLRTKIIARDVALDGDINPMLARHGEVSEARQYSGREVNDDWVCPLDPPERKCPRAT